MGIAFVNGRYGPLADAAVHVEDRGLQFADAVYEVCAVLNGRLLDWDKHCWRLRRGLAALFIEGVMGDAALGQVAARLLRANRAGDGLLYIQVTRGSARRDHPFPRDIRPTLIMTWKAFDFAARLRHQREGLAAVSLPDQRWARCDIKTTGLLANVLAKQAAKAAGGAEAVLVREDGVVTEGGSTNIWIVDAAGVLRTHPLSARILPGVMRDTLIGLARERQMLVEERAFTLDEVRSARELFMTSTTAPVVPLVTLDGVAVGDGRPGPVATRLADAMWGEIERQTGWRVSGAAG
ncbi:D-amino-acid transaminase [Sandaracinobacteroides saxicola]|uniref:Probable branched-chain-amino-acid aminotransferase n=1 Tax=Sandaracinobacteroides saxicola TaxID=2759707 RepID=A0A7G5IIZ7_9SPHN|nr:D-amino-acid transaminase [Sandaracinobacteroides saxicola]QMW23339.1 D-amino-acid transaminase [Sandaracinobacteroides saxicola]